MRRPPTVLGDRIGHRRVCGPRRGWGLWRPDGGAATPAVGDDTSDQQSDDANGDEVGRDH